jgi:hypothetical protein
MRILIILFLLPSLSSAKEKLLQGQANIRNTFG